MHRLVLYVVWVFLFVVGLVMPALAFEASAQADANRLAEKAKSLGDHANDLAEIGRQIKKSINPSQIHDYEGYLQAYADLDERSIAMELATDANGNASQLFKEATLLMLYGRMSCDLDKALIRQFLQDEMRSHAKMLDGMVGLVNLSLAQTRRPGVATTAARLRDDYRESKALIESIVLE